MSDHLTYEEYENAICHTDEFGSFYVFQIAKHKTVLEHGAAPLVADEELYSFMQVYEIKFRNAVLQERNVVQQNFFITWSGSSIGSSDVYARIQSIWKMAGNSSNIGTSAVRKALTTQIHASHSQHKEGVARHLCHRTSTAEAHYRLQTKTKASVTTSKIIAQTLDAPSPASERCV